MVSLGVQHQRQPPHLHNTAVADILSIQVLFPLFQDVLEEMEAEYAKQREAVKAAVKERGIEVSISFGITFCFCAGLRIPAKNCEAVEAAGERGIEVRSVAA